MNIGFSLIGECFDFLCEFFYFGGNHRKALAALAGPGSLYGCVDGKNIGLVRDGDDFVDTFADAGYGGLQF